MVIRNFVSPIICLVSMNLIVNFLFLFHCKSKKRNIIKNFSNNTEQKLHTYTRTEILPNWLISVLLYLPLFKNWGSRIFLCTIRIQVQSDFTLIGLQYTYYSEICLFSTINRSLSVCITVHMWTLFYPHVDIYFLIFILFYFFHFFKFYFIFKLYIIVLVLPNIKMNPPQVYILLQHHSSRASILQCSAFFMVQFLHPHVITRKTIDSIIQTFVGKVMSILLICYLG